MVITDIKYIKNNGAQIMTDDDLCLVIDDTSVSKLSLSKGMELSDETLTVLEKESALHFAKVKAFASLSKGDFSKAGLVKRLREKGATKEAADETADKMQNIGLVDDKAYAGRLCRVYSREKHFGTRRVMTELFRKGINRETAEQAIDEFAVPDSENVYIYFEKKFGKIEISDQKTRKKVADALVRAGFGWEDINACLRDFLTT